ncbi:hypothetical protein AXA44_45175 [Rhodococcus sp. SC4]|nr:hypothetical protein AXA44_45175 [Rhodococcus sp. SC4]
MIHRLRPRGETDYDASAGQRPQPAISLTEGAVIECIAGKDALDIEHRGAAVGEVVFVVLARDGAGLSLSIVPWDLPGSRSDAQIAGSAIADSSRQT